MTKSIPPQNSIHTFDPRLRQMLEAGTTRQIVIKAAIPIGAGKQTIEAEKRRLTHLRNRLNALRYDLAKSGNAELAEVASRLYRAHVRLDFTGPVPTLFVEPRDTLLHDLLNQFEDGGEAPAPVLYSPVTLADADALGLDELDAMLDDKPAPTPTPGAGPASPVENADE